MNNDAISVAVIEDHPVFLQALSDAIREAPDVAIVATASDVDEGLRMFETVRPNVLLVDLGLPSGSGLTLIHEARRRWGNACASAVLTMTGNEHHLLKAIRAGANGYLFKSDESPVWLAGIRALAAEGGLICSGFARHILNEHQNLPGRAMLELIAAGYSGDEAATRLGISEQAAFALIGKCYEFIQESSPGLSSREAELLVLLNQGCSFRQSAERMSIQECTAKTLAARAYQKLGANNLQEALYAARREHIFP